MLGPRPLSQSAYDTHPDVACRAIETHRGPVLVDLDETLYLRNSTEDFLDSAWPGPLAFLLVRLLDLLRPWRLTGGLQTRDVWRVAAICIVLPWSLPAWRRTAKRLGREASNAPLVEALNGSDQRKFIVTLGFQPIVAPLVAGMGVRDARLIAMSPWRFRDRRRGKRALVEEAIGEAAVRDALLVTDSLDDLDLLTVCLQPLRVVWPGAAFHPAFRDVYLPGLYISRVKRPGQRYIYRGIISDEYSLWLLASLPFIVTEPLLHVVGLALLSVSFWAIYEQGYVDNDLVGARHEADPKLTREFFETTVRPSAVLPWAWAATCGVAALLMLRWPAGPTVGDFAAWAAVLMLTCFWFRLYNRLDKRTRVWLFAGLQGLRSASFVAVVSISLVGAAALISHVLARWVPYYAYRISGTRYNDEQVGSSRLLFFVVITAGLAMGVGWETLWTPTALVLLAWFAFKARRELIRSYRQSHFITKGRAPTGPIPARQPAAPRVVG